MTKQEIIDYMYDNHVQGDFKIEEMAEDLARSEIIRCKDCKHWHNAPASDGFNSCEKDALIRHESFFCADAELRGEQDG